MPGQWRRRRLAVAGAAVAGSIVLVALALIIAQIGSSAPPAASVASTGPSAAALRHVPTCAHVLHDAEAAALIAGIDDAVDPTAFATASEPAATKSGGDHGRAERLRAYLSGPTSRARGEQARGLIAAIDDQAAWLATLAAAERRDRTEIDVAIAGVADLLGNLHEWCDDGLPGGAGDRQPHYRGGSWGTPRDQCRADTAVAAAPEAASDTVGFRLVVEAIR